VNIDTYRGENVALDMITHGLTDARREVRPLVIVSVVLIVLLLGSSNRWRD
jgi:hypothetical protein